MYYVSMYKESPKKKSSEEGSSLLPLATTKFEGALAVLKVASFTHSSHLEQFVGGLAVLKVASLTHS